VTAIALSGHDASGPDEGSDTPSRFTLADDGMAVTLDEGGTLILDLEANPTTGYSWEIDAIDETVLRPDGEPVFLNDSDLLGSPGTMTFTFEAAGEGETVLRLIYHRPWEDTAPLQTVTLSIAVG